MNASATSEITKMNNFQLLEYAAWVISVLFGLYMLFDLIKTNRAYSEDILTSSKEGQIDDTLVIDPPHQGGHLPDPHDQGGRL